MASFKPKIKTVEENKQCNEDAILKAIRSTYRCSLDEAIKMRKANLKEQEEKAKLPKVKKKKFKQPKLRYSK